MTMHRNNKTMFSDIQYRYHGKARKKWQSHIWLKNHQWGSGPINKMQNAGKVYLDRHSDSS